MHSDVLISIKPRFVDSIVSGCKRVELRTRPLRLGVGTRIWIYSTLPVGRIEAVAEVQHLIHGAPAEIWPDIKEMACISRDEFEAYVGDRQFVFVIGLDKVAQLPDGPDLDTLRAVHADFQPPQFFKKLLPEDPLLTLLAGSRRLA